ncbi:hypothetical protein [Rossellomorea marisflavi]|nr:hypothetical protein [Rossellomorea marisflavi]
MIDGKAASEQGYRVIKRTGSNQIVIVLKQQGYHIIQNMWTTC